MSGGFGNGFGFAFLRPFVGLLGGEATEIFASLGMNAIDAAGVLEVTDDNSRYNIGTGGFGVSAWVYATSDRPTVSLFDKYNKQSFDQWIQFAYGSSGITMNYGYNPGHLDQEFSFGNPYVQNQWVHVLVWFPRTSRYATPTLFLDGVEFIGGSWTVDDADVSIINFNALPRLAQGRTIITSGTISNRGVPAMWGILNSEPTQADATALHNAGNPLCWDLMEDVQKDKFDGFYETLMYDVKTEEEARTDKVNGYIMGNKWGSPFDLAGLDVECEAQAPSAWTPADFTGNMVSWTDPSDLSSIDQTANAVSELRDQQAGIDPFVQATASAQPITGAESVKGLNLIKYDGSLDSLGRSNPLTEMRNNTAFIVIKHRASNAGIVISYTGSTSSPVRWDFMAHFNNTDIIFTAGNNTSQIRIPTVLNVGETYLFSMISEVTTGNSQLYMNNILIGSNTPTVGQSPNTITLGATSSVTGFKNVSIGENILVEGVLPPTDFAKFNTYLMDKWIIGQ